MQIDSPTVRRLRDLLHERAGLRAGNGTASSRPALDESSPEAQALLARVAPICEALYLMMVADDATDTGEVESIRGALLVLTAGALSAGTIAALLQRYAAAAAQQGREARLAHVAALLSADREDAEATLALAAAVAVADGAVAGSEEHWLTELCGWLGISQSRAAVILDTSR